MEGWGLLGRILILAGLGLAVLGALILLAGKVPWLGRLPGDIIVRGERYTFYFPIVTCLLLSLALTALWWIVQVLRRS